MAVTLGLTESEILDQHYQLPDSGTSWVLDTGPYLGKLGKWSALPEFDGHSRSEMSMPTVNAKTFCMRHYPSTESFLG